MAQMGRPPGSLNKTTESLRTLARSYSGRAIARLATLMDSENESVARLAAVDILNRAYGMPKQMVEIDGELNIKSISVQFLDKETEVIDVVDVKQLENNNG